MGGSSRQDSIRSGYMSDHEALGSGGPNGVVGGGRGRGGRRGGSLEHPHVSMGGAPHQMQQDTRMCYLTSSEVSDMNCVFSHVWCIQRRNCVAVTRKMQ